MHHWHRYQWKHLWFRKVENRLPHALLFRGMAGIGKAHFALKFARMMLCPHANEEGSDCFCRICHLINNRTHSNVLWVEPEDNGTIKIDHIRQLSEYIQLSSLSGAYRLGIIDQADRMNANAANALLKTLEEPPARAILVLISAQPSLLPATILSRCQQLHFYCPSREEALSWVQNHITEKDIDANLLLNMAQGAPLAAVKLLADELFINRKQLFKGLFEIHQQIQNPLVVAAQMQVMTERLFLDFVFSWMMDILRLQLGATDVNLTNQDFNPQLQELAQQTRLQNNIAIMDYLQQCSGMIASGINLNKQLLFEDILIRWTKPEIMTKEYSRRVM